MKTIKIAAITAFAAFSLPALAQYSTDQYGTPRVEQYGTPRIDQHSTPRIDRRQENQERRIEQGVRSGQISRREAAGLREELREIRRMERRAAADGRVSPREQARIEQAQDQLSRNIASARRNFHTQDYQARRN